MSSLDKKVHEGLTYLVAVQHSLLLPPPDLSPTVSTEVIFNDCTRVVPEFTHYSKNRSTAETLALEMPGQTLAVQIPTSKPPCRRFSQERLFTARKRLSYGLIDNLLRGSALHQLNSHPPWAVGLSPQGTVYQRAGTLQIIEELPPLETITDLGNLSVFESALPELCLELTPKMGSACQQIHRLDRTLGEPP
jgi:hypothetical protein